MAITCYSALSPTITSVTVTCPTACISAEQSVINTQISPSNLPTFSKNSAVMATY
uniref:Uncharacterized protein n=1 Tax=Romanomermis culicivorax TaxID=13658 RepID=A0A915IY37_ROMCU